MKIMESRGFFSLDRPSGMPSDAPPTDWESLAERARALDAGRYPLMELRAILERENTRLGASEAALESVRGIGPNTVFVVCGQQAGSVRRTALHPVQGITRGAARGTAG